MLLLAPRDRSAVIPKDILSCAVYPRTLKYYNWTKYILETICDSAEKLREDLAAEHKTLLHGGCLLYLHVSTQPLLDCENYIFPLT